MKKKTSIEFKCGSFNLTLLLPQNRRLYSLIRKLNTILADDMDI